MATTILPKMRELPKKMSTLDGDDEGVDAGLGCLRGVPAIAIERPTPAPAPVELGDQPLLFTPGPLNTSARVKRAMLRDVGSRSAEFKRVTDEIRTRLLKIAGVDASTWSAVIMQGCGTMGNEATIGTALPRTGGRLLVPTNGSYSRRLADIGRALNIVTVELPLPEDRPIAASALAEALEAAKRAGRPYTHVALVQCETSSGLLNDVQRLGALAASPACGGASVIVDAMSSFGLVPLDLEAAGVDWLVSSANKCLQGVPGFSFVLAKKAALAAAAGNARSLTLDVAAQWRGLEADGAFRFTPPTHAMLAFVEALREYEAEGGLPARRARAVACQAVLRAGMAALGFEEWLAPEFQSPVITSFLYPAPPAPRSPTSVTATTATTTTTTATATAPAAFDFKAFYERLEARGVTIYAGKLSATADAFRIGSIGTLTPRDVGRLLEEVALAWPPSLSQPPAPAAAVRAVLFDWAGTTVDFGSRAPLQAFLEVFRRRGVELDEEEARKPMGLSKRTHIAELLAAPEVKAKLGPTDTVDALHAEFEDVLEELLLKDTRVIPGVLPAVRALAARGVRVGTTTGYSSRQMVAGGVVAAAAAAGFAPAAVVSVDQVPEGRPAPYMVLSALRELDGAGAATGTPPLCATPWLTAKVGDTVADVAEARAAGCWAVAVTATGNELGLSEAQLAALPAGERSARIARAAAKLAAAGADYVVADLTALPDVIDDINARLARGERPC